MRWSLGRRCPLLDWGREGFFHFWGLERRILVDSLAHPRVCFDTATRSRRLVRLPSLTFQADCGSIKGAGVPAEQGTERYLPWQ